MFEEIESMDAETFNIDNDQKAEWALRKIAEIDIEHNRLDKVCEMQIKFYQEKQHANAEKRNLKRGNLVAMLADYFENVKPKITKTQAKYVLPSGSLIKKFEKKEMKADAEILIAQLAETEYVEQKSNLKWGEYKKTLEIVNDIVVDRNGEIVNGVVIETKPGNFDVEVVLD